MRPALGRSLPAMTLTNVDTEETRKRITAALSESPTAVVFDNVTGLSSPDLAAALTANIWRDRPLGASRLVEFPVRCVWLATANNPALTLEVIRRTVRIRLDAGVSRPWLRDGFRHADLVGWTMAHRGDLITAALTMAQAWIARGRPLGQHPRLGTYEAWSDVMGGILHTAGIPGFLGNLTGFYETVTDDETSACHALVAAWSPAFGTAAVGVADLLRLTQGPGGIDLDLGDQGPRSQRTRLGKLLGRMRDRVFDGLRVTAGARVHGSQTWRLCGVTAATTEGGPAQQEHRS
jgi:hypothetical protein